MILWDVPSFRPLRALTSTAQPTPLSERSTRSAFSPDGQRLATAAPTAAYGSGTSTKAIRVDSRVPITNADQINTLAYSPDGQLHRHRTRARVLCSSSTPRSLSQVAPVALPRRAGQGPVESLTFHPDGRLAVSSKSDRADISIARVLACDLEIRGMPAGNIVHQRPGARVGPILGASALMGAGWPIPEGAAQEIYIQDMAQSGPSSRRSSKAKEVPRSISASRRIARRSASRASRSTRPIPLRSTTDSTWASASDARSRAASSSARSRNIKAGGSREASTSIGWSWSTPTGGGVPLILDPATDRLWWSSTFIPPAARPSASDRGDRYRVRNRGLRSRDRPARPCIHGSLRPGRLGGPFARRPLAGQQFARIRPSCSIPCAGATRSLAWAQPFSRGRTANGRSRRVTPSELRRRDGAANGRRDPRRRHRPADLRVSPRRSPPISRDDGFACRSSPARPNSAEEIATIRRAGRSRSLPASTGSEYSFGDGFSSLSSETSSTSSFPRRFPQPSETTPR